MIRVLVRRTRIEDVEYLIENLREADKIEIQTANGRPYFETIIRAMEFGDESWSAFADDELVAVFGVHINSIVTGSAIPWLLSTKNIYKYKKEFFKYSKPIFKKLIVDVDYMMNYVDDRNVLAKRWLKWLGFKFDDPIPYGPYQLPFRKFTMEVKHV